MQGVKHEPTEETRKKVASLSSMGVRYDDIAAKLGINDDTLVKYYRKELDDGRVDANVEIGKTLFEQAKQGNITAAIFWLKTRAGWKETQVNEVTGSLKLDTININLIKPNGSGS
jgi:hypothetical protein